MVLSTITFRASVCAVLLGTGCRAGPDDFPASRAPRQWPFVQDSIWNMPIGTGAKYTPQPINPDHIDGVPWARMMIAAEDGPDGCVPDLFKTDWGYDFATMDKTANLWFRDMIRIMEHLHIVTNNGPDSVGGGGEPRQPLAPPFRVEIGAMRD